MPLALDDIFSFVSSIHKKYYRLLVKVYSAFINLNRFLLCFFGIYILVHQSNYLRSQDLDDVNIDSIHIFNNLARNYKNTYSDSVYLYAKLAYQKAENINYTLGIIESSNNLGAYYLDQGKYLLAKKSFLDGLTKSKEIKAPYLEAVCKSNLAAYYYFTGAYDSALAIIDSATRKIIDNKDKQEFANLLNLISYIYAKKGLYYDALQARYEVLSIRLSLKDEGEIAKSYIALGDFFKGQNNNYKALDYYLKSFERSKKSGNTRGESISLTNIAEIYYRLEDLDKALDYHLMAIEIKKKNNLLKELGISYKGIALVYNAKNEFDRSLSYLTKAESLFKETQSLPFYSEALYTIAEVKFNQKAYDSAEYYLKETEKISLKIENVDLLLDTYKMLSKLYLVIDEQEEPNLRNYYGKYIKLSDSLKLEENKSQILELQAQFDDALFNERLNKVQDEKSQTEKELAKIDSQRLYLLFMFCGALFLMSFALYFYRRSSIKSSILKKHNLVIHDQNSHLKELNKQLKDSKRELEKINSTKNKLFAIISHDVRSPLSSLSGLLEVISETPEEIHKEEISELFLNLKNKVNTVDSFLNNLLGWARIQNDQIKVTATTLDLQELIEKIIYLYSDQAYQKRILIKSSIDIKKKVYADKDMLAFVIRNLLANAIKFTYPESTININCKEELDFAEISVIDQGIGMTEKELHHLFDLKQQVSQKGTFSEKGTGLGLILTKEFVERNKGSIRVESIKGKGSSFIFTIPLTIKDTSRVSQV